MSCDKLGQKQEYDEGIAFGEYLASLYPIYLENIAQNTFSFHGKPVRVFTDLNCNLQHCTFEHLTTKGNNGRLYNIKRCERIVWIKDILNGICQRCVKYRVFKDKKWKPNKPHTSRYIIWCTEEDYVIILEERERQVMLITAYCVLYENKRRDLERAFNES